MTDVAVVVASLISLQWMVTAFAITRMVLDATRKHEPPAPARTEAERYGDAALADGQRLADMYGTGVIQVIRRREMDGTIKPGGHGYVVWEPGLVVFKSQPAASAPTADAGAGAAPAK